jgi:hypothetical protein
MTRYAEEEQAAQFIMGDGVKVVGCMEEDSVSTSM